ncbi:MAG: hypothetical protein H7Z16_06635 [Pyrinomonadaceae bacterium]|nr:hypothetical protein [Pyrinomonadaceae bacterium]
MRGILNIINANQAAPRNGIAGESIMSHTSPVLESSATETGHINMIDSTNSPEGITVEECV